MAKETAEPNRQPHSERRFCFGSDIAEAEAKWHLPPSRTFTTKTFILSQTSNHFQHSMISETMIHEPGETPLSTSLPLTSSEPRCVIRSRREGMPVDAEAIPFNPSTVMCSSKRMAEVHAELAPRGRRITNSPREKLSLKSLACETRVIILSDFKSFCDNHISMLSAFGRNTRWHTNLVNATWYIPRQFATLRKTVSGASPAASLPVVVLQPLAC